MEENTENMEENNLNPQENGAKPEIPAVKQEDTSEKTEAVAKPETAENKPVETVEKPAETAKPVEVADFKARTDIAEIQKTYEQIRTEMGKVIVGQSKLIDFLIIAVLCEGHVLIEGMPGVAKHYRLNVWLELLNLSLLEFSLRQI